MITDDKINSFKKFILIKREINGKQEELTKSQKEVLLDYAKDSLNEGFSPNTIKGRLNLIKSFAYYVKKDFKEITKEEIKGYRDLKRDLKPGTLNNILTVIKLFFKWLYKVEGKGKYPEIVDWIKIKPPQQSEIRDSDLISFEEVKGTLIPACHNFRDKCLIMLMRETGARINEILATDVDDVRLRKIDLVVCYKIDRLSRSMQHFLQIFTELQNKGIGLVAISQPIDTTSASGRLLMQIISAFAEFEREMIIERVTLGKKRSKKKQGRKAKSIDEKAVIELHNKGLSYSQTAKEYNQNHKPFISHQTAFNIVKKYQSEKS